jgi:protein-S-isoprenylcysteine O-methyltransferase Ste14
MAQKTPKDKTMLVFEIIVFILVCFQLVIMTNNKQNKPDQKGESRFTNSTRYLMISLQYTSVLIVILSFFNNKIRIGIIEVPLIIHIIGIAFMLLGLSIRMVSMRQLGKYYSTLLFTNKDHQLITTGMYKYIRHPIYSGDIVFYLGYGFALSNYIVFMLIMVAFISAYLIRIKQEEKMMMEGFGDVYREYCNTTKKLIPFIY